MRVLTSKKNQPLQWAILPMANKPVSKLAVSSPTDTHEQEAEHIAERVTSQAGPGTLPAGHPESGGPLPEGVRAYFEPRFGQRRAL